jgi:hypothetical protein
MAFRPRLGISLARTTGFSAKKTRTGQSEETLAALLADRLLIKPRTDENHCHDFAG